MSTTVTSSTWAGRPASSGRAGPPSGGAASAGDVILVKRMLAGDESAFTQVVERYHGSLIRVAMAFVAGREAAKEVVQDTWLAVLRGLAAFEGRARAVRDGTEPC